MPFCVGIPPNRRSGYITIGRCAVRAEAGQCYTFRLIRQSGGSQGKGPVPRTGIGPSS